jgi:uncharacterized membrane protein
VSANGAAAQGQASIAPTVAADSAQTPGAALRAVITLALSAASLALIPLQLNASWLPAFIHDNRVAPNDRRQFVAVVLGAALAAVIAGAALLLRRGRSAVASLTRLARLCAVLPLVGLLPGLACPSAWPDPLLGALAIAAFVLACRPLLTVSFMALDAEAPLLIKRLRAPDWMLRRAPVAVTALAIGFYAAYMSYFTVLNHHHFNTLSFDLGIYDNQFWQALHGHPFRSTPLLHEGNWSVLKTHAELVMYAFLPIYALAPRAETLLVIQSLVLAAGAVPIYRLAARRLPAWTATLLVLAYLLYPPLHGANFYDFHFQPLGAAFVLYSIDFLDEGRYLRASVAVVMALCCREDISVGLFCFGIYLALEGKRFRVGLILAAVSATWFVVLKFIVMPRFGSYWFADLYGGLYPADDRSYGGIVKTLISNPWFVFQSPLRSDKLRYALQVIAPLAFLPLRRPLLWILVIPGAFFTILITPEVNIGFQYSCHWVPYLFFATVVALAEIRNSSARPRYRAAVATLALASLLCTIHWGAIPPRIGFVGGFSRVNFSPLTEAERGTAKDLAELVAEVPLDAKLAVSESELPHVSGRPECYTLRFGPDRADYILYAHNTGHYGSNIADAALKAGDYVLFASRPGLSLLKRVR